MRKVSKAVWLFLLAAPVAIAQTDTAAPAQPAPAVNPTAQQPLTIISGPQMLEQSREYRRQMDEIAQQIQAQVDKAKRDKDVIRLNCLLDKLSQVRVNMSIMDQSIQALAETVNRQDEAGMLHEYTRITIINQKVQVLRTEADACIGAETNYIGPTRVEVETPEGLAPGDPSEALVLPAIPASLSEPTPAASPYK